MTDSNRTLDFIVEQILKREDCYAGDAYQFMCKAVQFAHDVQTSPSAEAHLEVADLLEYIRLYALCEYGPMAHEVLKHWGVHATEDFGKILYLLSEFGEVELDPTDSPDKFRDGYDFESAFLTPFVPGQLPVNVPILDED